MNYKVVYFILVYLINAGEAGPARTAVFEKIPITRRMINIDASFRQKTARNILPVWLTYDKVEPMNLPKRMVLDVNQLFSWKRRRSNENIDRLPTKNFDDNQRFFRFG